MSNWRCNHYALVAWAHRGVVIHGVVSDKESVTPGITGRSFVYTRNRRGPRRDPCWTSAATGRTVEQVPSALTLKVRSLKYDRKKFTVDGRSGDRANLQRRPSCKTLSKALLPSNKEELVDSFLLAASDNYVILWTSWRVAECYLRNPNCSLRMKSQPAGARLSRAEVSRRISK